MKGRALVVVLALIMATVATAGVFLYARGVQEQAKTGGEMVSVIVSKVDIPTSSDLNQMISDGDFKVIQVPKTAVVSGAVTSIDQLRDQQNSQAIVANEQIPIARVEGTLSGGKLAIPDGYQAITLSLDSPRAVAGIVDQGDHVAIYATFKDVENIKNDKKIPDFTTVLVPSALVLAAYHPNAVESGLGGEQTPQGAGSVGLTLALTPQDAENMVFTTENGTVWLGLLAPKDTGTKLGPVSLTQVVR